MKELEAARSALFEPDISPAEFEARKQHYSTLYFSEREKYEKSFLAKLSLKQKQTLHKPLAAAIKLSNRLNGLKCVILSDERVKSDKPKIYAASHIGKFDIEVLSAVIGEHCTLLVSGFEQIHKTGDEIALALNGAIYFSFHDKADRKRAAEKMEDTLKSGGNILIFPEGAYNTTPDKPVTPLNWGVIKAARSTNAEIIPTAVEQYGKTFKICFGKFDVSHYGDDEAAAAAADLRDVLCTLKWKIYESEPALRRAETNISDWNAYIDGQLKNSGDTVSDTDRERYHPKNYVEYSDVFAHLTRIDKNIKTAFLFNKRLK